MNAFSIDNDMKFLGEGTRLVTDIYDRVGWIKLKKLKRAFSSTCMHAWVPVTLPTCPSVGSQLAQAVELARGQVGETLERFREKAGEATASTLLSVKMSCLRLSKVGFPSMDHRP